VILLSFSFSISLSFPLVVFSLIASLLRLVSPRLVRYTVVSFVSLSLPGPVGHLFYYASPLSLSHTLLDSVVSFFFSSSLYRS